jgi:uncharacterized protein
MTLQFIVIVAAVGLIIGFSKGGLSGLNIVALPLMALVVTPAEAVAQVLPLLIVGDVFTVWAYWGKWDNRLVAITLPFAAVGAVLGAYFITSLPDRVLLQLIGGLTLIYVGYRVLAARIAALKYDPPGPVGMFAGFTAGVASGLANAGAPPMAAYLLLKRIEPVVFIAMLGLVFAVINVIKVPVFVQSGLLNGPSFLSVIWAFPFVPVGVYAGRWFARWVPPRVFEIAVLVVLFITGVWLLVNP